jgi:hypothetical protein
MGGGGDVLRDTAGEPGNGVNEDSAGATGIREAEALQTSGGVATGARIRHSRRPRSGMDMPHPLVTYASRSQALGRTVSPLEFDAAPTVSLAEAHRMSLGNGNLQ